MFAIVYRGWFIIDHLRESEEDASTNPDHDWVRLGEYLTDPFTSGVSVRKNDNTGSVSIASWRPHEFARCPSCRSKD